MGVIGFLFFQSKANFFGRYICHMTSELLPPFDIDHLETVNFSNLSMCISFGRFCASMILARKGCNCIGTAFVQGDAVSGSKLTEETLHSNSGPAESVRLLRLWSDQKSCYPWSKAYISKALVGPIVVKSRFFSNGPIFPSSRRP